MKSNLNCMLAIVLATIFIGFNSAATAERVRIFEMAESGNIIDFPATGLERADLVVAQEKTTANEGRRLY